MTEREAIPGAASWLALVGDAFGGRGGIAQYNRDFFKAALASGQAGAIRILPRLAPDPVNLPPLVIQAPARSGRFMYALRALEAAARWPVDVVFCGHLYMVPLAWLIARLKRAKLVVQLHGIEAWTVPDRWRCAALSAADLVLCVSRHTRAVVLEWSAIAPERVVVVPNTVDERFVPLDMTFSAGYRANMGLGTSRLLLTVARMDGGQRYKGHEQVIAAMPQLLDAGHDVLYLIAGEGDDRSRLAEYARELGVSEQVRFLGPVQAADLPQIYNLADLYVMPSSGEGFGIAFLEAMASGTPAVGLDIAGARDALVDGDLGILVHPDQLLETIGRLLTASPANPQILSRRVRSRFGRPIFTAQLGRALGRLAER